MAYNSYNSLLGCLRLTISALPEGKVSRWGSFQRDVSLIAAAHTNWNCEFCQQFYSLRYIINFYFWPHFTHSTPMRWAIGKKVEK